MLKREHIEYEIKKIKKDIYDLEQEIFTCFTELQDRLDALNKYVRSTYGLGGYPDEKNS